MTAQLAVAPRPAAAARDDLAVLRAALRPDFLARAGWDPAAMTLTPARGDPLLGLRECAVAGCGASAASVSADLCEICRARWKASDLGWEEFLAPAPRPQAPRGPALPGAGLPAPGRVGGGAVPHPPGAAGTPSRACRSGRGWPARR